MAPNFILATIITPIPTFENLDTQTLIFIICQDKILIRQTEVPSDLPLFIQNPIELQRYASYLSDPELLSLIQQESNFKALLFGTYLESPCLIIYFPNPIDEPQSISTNPPLGPDFPHFQFVTLRKFFVPDPTPWVMIAGFALQFYHWDEERRYCGRCGAEFNYHPKEFSKLCPQCGNIQYPQIAPAIIVAIQKEEKILLAHNKRFGGSMYSVLAGFVVIGESLEETLVREVNEEVGIQVTNIRYFGSQPWPFPNSLMLGFQADWASGEIMCDGEEIETAQWFSVEDITQIDLPSPISIARQLINQFIQDQSGF